MSDSGIQSSLKGARAPCVGAKNRNVISCPLCMNRGSFALSLFIDEEEEEDDEEADDGSNESILYGRIVLNISEEFVVIVSTG